MCLNRWHFIFVQIAVFSALYNSDI